MSRHESRPRGAMVSRINAESLKCLVVETMTVLYGPESASNWEDYSVEDTFLGHGFDRQDKREGYFLVGTEGVGRWFDLNNLASVLAHNGWGTSVRVPVSLARMRSMQQEDVDLADVVRVFGDRLETNFGIWHSAVKGLQRA